MTARPLTPAQAELFDNMYRGKPVAMVADSSGGKTTALALAASRLAADGYKNILVVAKPESRDELHRLFTSLGGGWWHEDDPQGWGSWAQPWCPGFDSNPKPGPMSVARWEFASRSGDPTLAHLERIPTVRFAWLAAVEWDDTPGRPVTASEIANDRALEVIRGSAHEAALIEADLIPAEAFDLVAGRLRSTRPVLVVFDRPSEDSWAASKVRERGGHVIEPRLDVLQLCQREVMGQAQPVPPPSAAERQLMLVEMLLKGALSGAEIAMRLDVNRRTVYRDVRALRRQGVRIDGAPHDGYSLTEVAIPVDFARDLVLGGGPIAKRLQTLLPANLVANFEGGA